MKIVWMFLVMMKLARFAHNLLRASASNDKVVRFERWKNGIVEKWVPG